SGCAAAASPPLRAVTHCVTEPSDGMAFPGAVCGPAGASGPIVMPTAACRHFFRPGWHPPDATADGTGSGSGNRADRAQPVAFARWLIGDGPTGFHHYSLTKVSHDCSA